MSSCAEVTPGFNLVDNLPLFIVTFSPDGTLSYANEAVSKSIGLTPAQLIGRNFYEFLSTDDQKNVRSRLAALTPECPVESHEQSYLDTNGNEVFHRWTNKAIFDTDGNISFLQAIGEDISEQKKAENALLRSEAALKAAQRVANVGSWVWHLADNQTVWSDQMYQIFGVSKDKITTSLFETWQQAIHPEDRIRVAQANLDARELAYKTPVEYRIVWPDGTVRFVWAKADDSIHDENGKPVEMSGVVQDITERKQLENELTMRAHTDYLTGVNNRGHFIELAELELSRSIRYDNPLSILMLDIDFFKRVNDTHGHKAGDAALKKLAEVCLKTLRGIDIVGRFGGEEFTVLLPETGKEKAAEVAERLRIAIDNARVPLENGLPLHLAVSIGVASLTSTEDNLDVLLNSADNALYEAKKNGRNQVCVAA